MSTEQPVCPHCGGKLTPGGVAMLCGPSGGADLRLPAYCASQQCRRDRDAAAIARAVESGLIDP